MPSWQLKIARFARKLLAALPPPSSWAWQSADYFHDSCRWNVIRAQDVMFSLLCLLPTLLPFTFQQVNYSFLLLGCPFRHWDKKHLKRMLRAHGIFRSGSNKILEYVENSHYKLACRMYFEITHRVRVWPKLTNRVLNNMYLGYMLWHKEKTQFDQSVVCLHW